MQKFTQKYTIVHLVSDLPVGYEYSMQDWPLHVTLADVFAIEGDPRDLLAELGKKILSNASVSSRVIGDEWFGQDKSVHVKLLDKTDELQQLHEEIISVLETFNVKFNSPEYIKEGYTPHSTYQKNEHVEGEIQFDSITLIDMFPEGNAYQRRVLGTINLSRKR